jgi:HEAT repeat protein
MVRLLAPGVRLALALVLLAALPVAGQAPPADQLKALRTARTVLVEVHESYDDAPAAALPFEKIVAAYLSYAGLKTTRNLELADFVIAVKSSGEALSAIYAWFGVGPGGTTHYTGATVKGTVTVIAGGRSLFQFAFDGTEPTSASVSSSGHLKPASAPFGDALDRSLFHLRVAQTVAAVFGAPPLLKMLGSADPLARLAAAVSLAPMKTASGIDVLVAHLNAPSRPEYTRAVVEALGQTGQPRVFPNLLRVLKGTDSALQVVAVRAMDGLSDPRVVPALLAAIPKGEPAVRSEAFAVLNRRRASLTVAMLAPLADQREGSNSWDIRAETMMLLGALGDPAAIPLCERVIATDPHIDVRNRAVRAVAGLDHPDVIGILARLVNSDRPDVRSEAAIALVRLPLARVAGQPGVAPAFVWVLLNGSKDNSGRAAKALVAIHPPDLPGLFGPALRSGGADNRVRAVEVLGGYTSADATRVLLDALADREPAVRLAVVKQISGRQAPEAADGLGKCAVSDSDRDVRLAAAAALLTCELCRAAPYLVAAMDDEREAMMRVVRPPLEAMQEKCVIGALVGGLRGGSRRVRQRSAVVLRARKDPATVEPLMAVLDGGTSDSGVREAVVEALGAIGDRGAVPVLIRELAVDPSRDAAARVLGLLGDRRAVGPILKEFRNPVGDTSFDDALIQALARIGDLGAVEGLLPLLDDRSPLISDRAIFALQALTGEKFGGDKKAWKRWWAKNRGRAGR